MAHDKNKKIYLLQNYLQFLHREKKPVSEGKKGVIVIRIKT